MNAPVSSPGSDPACIFCKIVAGQIPSRKVFEDEHVLAFHDIAPWAPVHFLIIPKRHIPTLYDAADVQHRELLGHMLWLPPPHQHRRRRPPGSAPPAPARDGRPAALEEGLSSPCAGGHRGIEPWALGPI
jgi:hypothetical protein